MTCPACSATVPTGAPKCPTCGLNFGTISGHGAGTPTPVVNTPTMTRPQNGAVPIISAILGVISWIGLGIIASIPAVVTGHIALRGLQPGNSQAKTFAIIGLIAGYANIAFAGLLLLLAGMLSTSY